LSPSEELMDFIPKNRRRNEPYIRTSRFKYTLEQDGLGAGFMALYTNGHMMLDTIYDHISYQCCRSNACKLKDGHDPKICFVEKLRSTWMQMAEHLIRPGKVIPSSHVKAKGAQLLIMIYRQWRVLKWVEERRERGMAGKGTIPILM
jgi:hypothetical protein